MGTALDPVFKAPLYSGPIALPSFISLSSLKQTLPSVGMNNNHFSAKLTPGPPASGSLFRLKAFNLCFCGLWNSSRSIPGSCCWDRSGDLLDKIEIRWLSSQSYGTKSQLCHFGYVTSNEFFDSLYPCMLIWKECMKILTWITLNERLYRK